MHQLDQAIRSALKCEYAFGHEIGENDTIRDGRIVQRGTHDELVNQPGIYQSVYNLQARIEDELAEEIMAAGD